jgi:drug/metabolite transporter (DMT)-like permease
MQTSPPARPPVHSRGAVFLAYFIIYVVWGSTYLAIRVAVETLPPLLMAGVRFTLAGALVYAWRRLRGDPRPTRADWWPQFLTGALLLLGGNGLVVWAEQHRLPSGAAALLVATTPLWVALVDWARPGGVRPSLMGVAGLLLGFVGAGLLVAPGLFRGGTKALHPIYSGAVVLAAFSWAIGSVYMARHKGKVSPALGSGMQMFCGGLLLLAAGFVVGEARTFHWNAVSWHSLGALAYLFVFGSLIAFSTYVWLLKVEPPARVATYAYVNPVVAVLLGWWLADEPITALTLIAAAVIVGGVVLITRSRQVKRGIAATAVEEP